MHVSKLHACVCIFLRNQFISVGVDEQSFIESFLLNTLEKGVNQNGTVRSVITNLYPNFKLTNVSFGPNKVYVLYFSATLQKK